MDMFIQYFHWLRPYWLFALPVIMVAFAYLIHAAHLYSNWQQCIDKELLEHLLNKGNAKHSNNYKFPLYAAAIACCICIVALAGPSWEKLPEPPLRKEVPMIIIADLTLSMHAEDVEPSRLIRMRYKLLELLKQRHEGQTALIAYSGSAHIVSPLTDDANTIAALVPALSPEIIPSIGSDAAAAFELADTLIAHHNGRVKLIWFTDETMPSDKKALAKLAKKHKLELLIIGIGTENGGPIRLPSGKFLKDQHDGVAHAKLDKRSLKQLANNLHGRYLDLQNDNSDIKFALSDSFSLNAGNNAGAHNTQTNNLSFNVWQDRGAWLCLALLPFTALLFRRGWLLAGVMMTITLQSPELIAATDEKFSWQDLWQTRDQQAAKMRANGNLNQATKHFNDPAWQGATAYEKQDYAQAIEAFARVLDNPSSTNTAQAHYNHGHALAQSQQFQAAINAYDTALKLDPNFTQATQAKSIVEQLLNQQQQEQQQSDEQSDKQQQDENSESQPNDNNQSSDSAQDDQQSQQQNEQQGNQQEQEPKQQQNNSSSDQQKNTNAENTEQAQANEQTEQNDDRDAESQLSQTPIDSLDTEQKAQLNQWLNKIKDDPAGLLRRKFQYERQQQEQEGMRVTPNENGKIW